MTPKSDAEWQAECDADTLANAEAIKGDPKRMAAAAKKAKTMQADADKHAKQAQARARAMKRVAKKTTKRPAKRGGGKKR